MNTRPILFILLCICLVHKGNAQCGTTGDTLVVNTVDELIALTPCDTILGSLLIHQWDISDLEPLANLIYVEEHFILSENISLLNINDLSNLVTVGGNLEFKSNFTLASLSGLESLSNLGGDLVLDGNITLEEIDAFVGLTELQGNLFVVENHVIGNLDGLQNIESVEGNVILQQQNLVLSDLSGLNSLVSVEGAFFVSLPALTTISGLESLNYVGGDFELSNMDLLANLDELVSLMAVEGTLSIHNNSSLVNINGIESLESVGQNLAIHDNAALSTCCGILPVIIENGIVGEIIFANNNSGCNGTLEIELACAEFIEDVKSLELEFICNSSRRQIRFRTNDHAVYYLWSLSGAELARGVCTPFESAVIDLPQSGLYGLSVHSGNDVIVRRFIIQ